MIPPRSRVALAALTGLLALAAAAAAEPPPFELRELRVPGRPIDVVAIGQGPERPRLLVISVEGTPPEERRHVSLFPPLRPGTPAAPEPWQREAGPEVVAVDAADVRPAPGPEILLLSAGALRIAAPAGEDERLPLPAPLPLPPRTRDLSRLAFVRDWNGDGAPAALLPSLRGLVLLPLDGRPPRELALPVDTLYETPAEDRPVHSGYAEARLVWPGLALADDDGDGRPDLFATDRFRLRVFRSGTRGLAPVPTRTARMPLFSPEEERRHDSNSLRAFVTDLDGDGRADLVVHRTEGSLMRSHASTSVFRNPGTGAVPSGAPAATLEARGGFGSIQLQDLDADGRDEIVQTVVPFGVLQLVRVLVRRQVEARLAVYRFRPEGGDADPLVRTWQADLSYPLDFDEGRIVGLLPTLEGDWNGDGRKDLLHGSGGSAVEIRLGRGEEAGPAFGPVAARQELPVSDRAVVVDLDRDGLDDLVLFDPVDASGRIVVGWNRAALPGSPPQLRAPAR